MSTSPNTNNNNLTKILAILVLVFMIGTFISVKSCRDKNDEQAYNNKVYNSNLLAMQDTITHIKLRNGQLEYSHGLLVGNMDTVLKYNAKLAKDIKSMEGRVISYIKANCVVKIPDTVYVTKTTVNVLPNGYSVIGFDSRYKDSGMVSNIKGKTAFKYDTISKSVKDASVSIDENSMAIDLSLATVDVDSGYSIVVKSKSKYVSFNSIEGAYFPKNGAAPTPKQSNFNLSLSAGLGYGVFSKSPDVYVGLTAGYNISSLFKRFIAK